MSLPENSPVHLVNRPDLLQQCLAELVRCNALSLDLEFDNHRYGYGITLCLVQVATPRACFVIDPLADLDLGGLFAVFESAGIQKIVHAPGEDLRLLHSLGCYPKNLFDTEVVARLLNYEQTSLAVLLREKLLFEMDKKQQKSNWLRRPLTQSQLQYAADDVIWLHPLKALLEAEAAERNLSAFVREEQELLSTTIYPALAKTTFLKPFDLSTLSPREQFVTDGLLGYVHELARSLNRPVYQVMSEELVRTLAAGARTPKSLLEEPGLHPRFRNNRFVSRLTEQLEKLQKTAAAENLSTDKPRRRKLSPAEAMAIGRASRDREQVFAPIQQSLAERFGIHAAKYLLSNRVVGELVQGTVALSELRPAYRQALIRDAAAAAGIDLGRYNGAKGID